MTNEKVISQLEDLQENSESFLEKDETESVWRDDINALNIAIDAVKKQIPTVAMKSDSGSYYICPSCMKLIEHYEISHGNIEIPYCKWCGQRIDWAEGENIEKEIRVLE